MTIHEFGHGYFYGILGSNEFEEPMLDEGLNEYWDQRMLRAAKRDVHLATPMMRKLGIDLRLPVFDYERLGAMTEHPADPLGQNSWARMSGGSYGTAGGGLPTTGVPVATFLSAGVLLLVFGGLLVTSARRFRRNN